MLKLQLGNGNSKCLPKVQKRRVMRLKVARYILERTGEIWLFNRLSSQAIW